MITLNEIFGYPFTTIVVSLIWARIRFFKIGSTTPNGIARLYDPVVIIHLATVYYFIYTVDLRLNAITIVGILLLMVSLVTFWWAIFTAKKIGFALSGGIEKLLVTGPYSLVRHPFYTSYCFTWIGTSIVFNSIVLWSTLVYLFAFYYIVAVREENIILKSIYSGEYEAYQKRVGMFLPRIPKWIK